MSFTIEKHARISTKWPIKNKWGIWAWDLQNHHEGIISVFPDKITFIDKKKHNTQEIFFHKINEVKEIDLAKSVNKSKDLGGCLGCNVIFLNYHNNKEIYLIFWSKLQGWQAETHNKVLKVLGKKIKDIKIKIFKSELLEYIEPYDEISFTKLEEHFKVEKNFIEEEIKGMLKDGRLKGRLLSDKIILREPTQKLEQTVYITIPPQTKLTALKCPNCQAPLEFMPPCKCEHCGVLIELMK